jgi:hypothetical protein
MSVSRQILSLYCLILVLIVPCQGAESQAEFDEPERIVVVGDIHGNYEGMRTLLYEAKLINKRGNWIAGKTHLVQLGDLPDRGTETRKVIKFLRKLEKQAKRKRGRVHILVGNHDAMNVYGDLRYVTHEEYSEFAGRDSEKRLLELYDDEVSWMKENLPEDKWPSFDEKHRENWLKHRPPGFVEHRWNWLPGGEIGDWVASRNAVVRIGRFLFVHGGIGPAYSSSDVSTINRLVREALQNKVPVEESILRNQEGPLWYRGQATGEGVEEETNLDTLLESFSAQHLVIGHTVTGGVILPRFEGKVILADTGITTHYGGHLACLVIEGSKPYALHNGVKIEIPLGGDSSALLTYLYQVAEFEPENSHLRKRIRDLEIPKESSSGQETASIEEGA